MALDADDPVGEIPGARSWRSWFAPAAAVAGLAALVAGALRSRPTPRLEGGRPSSPQPPLPAALPQGGLAREYTPAGTIGAATSLHPFRRSLAGLAVGPDDAVFALGDGEVRVFDPDGAFVRSWPAAEGAQCLAIGPGGRVYVAGTGRVEIFAPGGVREGGFLAGGGQEPASLTSIKVLGGDVLIADASARIIRRYDAGGRQVGFIGDRTRTRAFILPNGFIDIAVDEGGIVRATDSGRHQVTSWSLDGTPHGKFGRFGMRNAEDFTGCCNPVNIAITPDGKVVTAEKAPARVKVFEPDGTLLAVIGPEHFDQSCTHIHLAVDSKGRLFAADTVRREIRVFTQIVRIGVNEPFCRETASNCVGGPTARDYGALAAVVHARTGVVLRLTYYPVEDDLVAAIGRGDVDGAVAKTWTALRAYDAAGVAAERLCDIPFPDGEPGLTGVFIARADGPVRALAQVSGKRLALGRPESYENSYAADRVLRGLAIEPAECRAAGGCIPAAVSVLDGEADVAVVSNYCTRYGLDEILAERGAFRVLGETAPIPFATLVVSERVPAATREAIKAALLGGHDPRGTEQVFPGGLRPPAPWDPEELSPSMRKDGHEAAHSGLRAERADRATVSRNEMQSHLPVEARRRG
ncbi:MAG: PhnD/SsuA/transferrin family substrate-binding protein [Acidobacteriota bacterium]